MDDERKKCSSFAEQECKTMSDVEGICNELGFAICANQQSRCVNISNTTISSVTENKNENIKDHFAVIQHDTGLKQCYILCFMREFLHIFSFFFCFLCVLCTVFMPLSSYYK